jgi:hypothetical protein
MKIDIEAFEPYAFENSTKLFEKFKIVSIFIEFGKIVEKYKSLNNNNSYRKKVLNMLNEFKALNYEPYEVNGYNQLDYNDWRNWPWDVYLRQCDSLHCPGRPYKVQGV